MVRDVTLCAAVHGTCHMLPLPAATDGSTQPLTAAGDLTIDPPTLAHWHWQTNTKSRYDITLQKNGWRLELAGGWQ